MLRSSAAGVNGANGPSVRTRSKCKPQGNLVVPGQRSHQCRANDTERRQRGIETRISEIRPIGEIERFALELQCVSFFEPEVLIKGEVLVHQTGARDVGYGPRGVSVGKGSGYRERRGVKPFGKCGVG